MTAIRTSDPASPRPSHLRPVPDLLPESGVGERLGERRRRFARAIVLALLGRIRHGHLEVVETDGVRRVFGSPGGRHAEITVYDDRAWWAVAREGSIGLGRGYIEGWWHSDDPTEVVRLIIANLGPIDAVRGRFANFTAPMVDPVLRRRPRRDRRGDREDIASHYDIGNDFFSLFLDDTMTYSSGVFPRPGASMLEASLHKYDRILDKLHIGPDHRVLEIGTGWGGFAIRAASRRGCQVTTTTISEQQLREASDRVGRAGLADRIDVVGRDWRDLEGRFDALVSIEMIEAVDWRDYAEFFATIEHRLTPDGVAGIQVICVPDERFESAKRTEDFIRRFVFPGGGLPSVEAIEDAVGESTRLHVVDVEDITEHYAETLRRWRGAFEENLDRVVQLGLDERFCRLWRFYLSYCEAAFAERHCHVHQIVLARPGRTDR